jgi:hypothetical protein
MERIRHGFRLLRASSEVLRADKELLLLPAVSFLAIVIVTALLGGLAWASGLGSDQNSLAPVHYVYLGIFYFVVYFIAIFFNAAVVGAATIRLAGGDPTPQDGLRLARSKTGKIAAWAGISATVGLILRSLEERLGFLGDIVVGLIGVAWGAVTFFVVPVLLYEPVGAVDGIKRSASIFRQRWGEQMTGNAAIGLAMVVLGIPVMLVAVLLGVAWLPLGLVVGAFAVGTLVAVGTAVSGVFQAALYRYATTGASGGAFDATDLQSSFRRRKA